MKGPSDRSVPVKRAGIVLPWEAPRIGEPRWEAPRIGEPQREAPGKGEPQPRW